MIRQLMFFAQSYQLMNESVSIHIANTLIELIRVLDLVQMKNGKIIFPKIIIQMLQWLVHRQYSKILRKIR